ncbi:DUF2267 domain-containing protein [Nocardia cyriacigeorgica]|uniref:DUF2267 domain-containing protein n=3 Tax=Nocardia TaxID=1817 RepID=H6RA64_NOCCG|nr:DUF2267 domain-containing protein [Nocardia cyriacigeorgica]NEW32714.1 DUF2267 domain-containing protein [Nocardia cyriacigeorgica]BDT87311.1 hypothetical protein FMUAM8_30750 [Nocardia cyriacigeorgica]CCF63672.1 protein of unknown function [Nocardia cyriacigeorgica GUH-2]
MHDHDDPLAPAIHTAYEWLRAITEDLGTFDRAFAHRVIRAWLHSVRDRLGVATTAQLGAQLPEVFRGILYEGWRPSHVPKRHDTDGFLAQFAEEAGVTTDEAAALAAIVTEAFSGLFSEGQLDRTFAELPRDLRELLRGDLLSGTMHDHAAPHLARRRSPTRSESATD